MNKRNKTPKKASKTHMGADGSGIQSERIPVGSTGVSISIREIPVGDGGGNVRILKVQKEEMTSGGKNKS